MTAIFKLTLPLNDVHNGDCAPGCGDNVDAETQSSPSFRGRRPWNPTVRGTRPTVDAGGFPLPPSSSRSGDPPRRGNAVRYRYLSATNGGIPARSARMTAEFEKRCRYHGGTIWGIASSQSPLGSASALRRKLRSLPCSSFSDAIRFAGFASETRVVAYAPSE